MIHLAKVAARSLLSAAVTAGLLAFSSSAHATQVVTYNPGSGATNDCSTLNAVFAQNGNNLEATAYVFGAQWANGACNGAGVPEDGVAMEAVINFWTGTAWEEISNLTYSTEMPYVFNTDDFFGLYFANIPGAAGLSSAGSEGLTVPYTALKGPGYYELAVTTWVESGGSWHEGSYTTPWFFADIPVAPPPPR